ncbi:MAG: ABC transporter ATP-binding protein [Synoicihabitans sp.]
MTTPIPVLWRMTSGHRLRYGAAFACLVVATALNYGIPLVGTAVIDHALGDKPLAESPALIRWFVTAAGGTAHLTNHLWLAPLVMVGLSVVAGGFSFAKGWLNSLASDGIARELKNRLYDHLNHLPASYHDRVDTGDLVQRCTSDVETLRVFLATQITEIAQAFLLMAIALPLLWSLSPPLTGVAFALIGPIILYGYIYFRSVKHVFKQVDEAEGDLTTVVQENLTGIRVVRAFARHDFEKAKFAEPNTRFRDRHLRLLRLMSWYWSISDFVAMTQLGLVLLVGAHWVAAGTITVGVLFAFMAFLGTMLWPVRQLGRILTDLGKTTVALNRIGEILNVPREPEPVARPVDLPAALTGAIAVRDLRFKHGSSDTQALNGVSFEVSPGETLAILGPSGAGKSTLMHVLLRLYDYEQGSVQLDGHELSDLPRGWLRDQFGVVMQEPFLFSKSLRANLRLGRRDAPDHEIEAAARAASIHETITRFDHGYETLVGERGVTLSGGQRQRLAIARALLKDAPLLILDDALSAVDAETESLIVKALRSRRGRATTLVIAHRLATLAHADRVLVLDQGRIVQVGTHAELAAQPGFYQRLWRIQTDVENDLAADLSATR